MTGLENGLFSHKMRRYTLSEHDKRIERMIQARFKKIHKIAKEIRELKAKLTRKPNEVNISI